ncbi:hypothetical protein AAFC00_001993 [Neodothiora populina]|uniref:ER-bound oxygenase mpaB/mpaB'/Rubber oxygenase catalytic domain-containing protein n=1 Tax=Neodothiora populina TaxID=2781224 RepID=A0ABR3PFZ7_9PEZI
MAWPNPFRTKTENTRNAWGYEFELTPQHLTPKQYDPLKYTYDELGEAALNRLNEIAPPASVGEIPRNSTRDLPTVSGNGPGEKEVPVTNANVHESAEKQENKQKPPARDLYELLKRHAGEDEVLSKLWKELNTVPEWVDWDQISRGQDVFYRYGGANLTGLAYQSLLGGMGAARVVETLARTGGFSTKVARGRLFETTQHVLQCTKSLESIQPGGDGFASTIRVRLLHAAVRNRIMKLEASRPGYYDVKEWGIPINDLDSIATIDTFSASIIWLSLPRQGLYLREQEAVDYIALWRYVAYLIGCPHEGFFENTAQAKRIFESLLLYEIHPSPTSQVLANNIIKCLQDQPPGYASADFLIAGARWLNGNKLCDALGLPRPSLYYSLLMAGQCVFFCFWCYLYRAIPSWDRRKIDTLRRIFWAIVVESKYGLKGEMTSFNFKYVPEYETITEMGGAGEAQLKYQGVEWRNLKTLVIASGVAGVVAWGGFRLGLGMVRLGVSATGWLLSRF